MKICSCPPPDVAPEKQRIVIRVEKRKNQRFVTKLTGFECSKEQIHQLFLELKNQCGAGGSTGEDWLEIQGDHALRMEPLLVQRGYRISKGKGK